MLAVGVEIYCTGNVDVKNYVAACKHRHLDLKVVAKDFVY